MSTMSEEYKIILTNRKSLYIEGVEHVVNFTEEEISLDTKMGYLVLRGEGLDVTQLNLEDGNLEVEGLFKCIDFSSDPSQKSIKNRSKGLLERLLK